MSNWDIIQAKYMTSAVKAEQYPVALTQIAFIGRSNVGKSSLINSLCHRNNLARVSGTPGKTKTINFYEVGVKCTDEGSDLRLETYFVDLPGYGFAKTSKKERDLWSTFIGEYLKKTQNVITVCQLVDIRHAPLDNDVECYRWLQHCKRRILLVLTKADKLSKNQIVSQLNLYRNTFSLQPDEIIAYSSFDHKQRSLLVNILMDRVTEEK